jgi:hypothetical protein
MAGTGLRHFFIAKYGFNGNVVTYTDGGEFFDAISFNPSLNAAEANDLYVNDAIKESAGSTFGGGTIEIGTDHLSLEASTKLLGIQPSSITLDGTDYDNVMEDGESFNPPFVGFGTIRQGQLNNVPYSRAYIYTKLRFGIPSESFTTKGESVEWQTPTITANIYRDDTEKANWRIWADFATVAEAKAFILKYLGIDVAAG